MADSTPGSSAPGGTGHSLVDSKFPVFLPYYKELYMSDTEFNAFLHSLPDKVRAAPRAKEDPTLADQEKRGKKRTIHFGALLTVEDGEPPRKSPFMDALARSAARHADASSLAADGKTLTENGDVAYRSTGSALVDAFYELEGNVDAANLRRVLSASWSEDPLATLKILFNARSIHLGKSSRPLAYQAFGWLYEEHPKTLLTNLVWLVRPVIEKKIEKVDGTRQKSKARSTTDDDDDLVLVEGGGAGEATETIVNVPDGVDAHNIRNGVSHGYWKDLLNILALAAHERFGLDPKPMGQIQKPRYRLTKAARLRQDWDRESAKRRKVDSLASQHSRVVALLETDPKYRALHFTVARLFAEQLRTDCSRLTDGAASTSITYAGKWAPSPKEAHDKHTFVVSSIAELLHSHDAVCPGIAKSDREQYLKHAREAYRRLTISPLRRHLHVVERDITAKTYANIDYERLPSLAMQLHRHTFVSKDFERYEKYVNSVIDGKARTSGAVLLPSTLVHQVLSPLRGRADSAINARAAVQTKLADGQWKTLVRRMRDSGALKSSIAVCDVSASMTWNTFTDGTQPLHSAIGLSLLVAEACEPPFGGGFITFSADPTFEKVGGPGDKRTLAEKVRFMKSSQWGANTDFTAVFERLILPVAIENEIAPEDMVKQVFVFSDMQCDAADVAVSDGVFREVVPSRWTTSYERIKTMYERAGYEMPQLVFWNLAGGDGRSAGKPVRKDDLGTALVSGYSQGQLKMFLDGGRFEEPAEEVIVEEEEVEGTDADAVTSVKVKTEKPKMDPLAVVRKAISHPSYTMLKVVD